MDSTLTNACKNCENTDCKVNKVFNKMKASFVVRILIFFAIPIALFSIAYCINNFFPDRPDFVFAITIILGFSGGFFSHFLIDTLTS